MKTEKWCMDAAVGLLHQKPQQTALLLRYLGVRAQRAQVALQVSVGHQLHHHQGGLAFGHNTQQTHLRGKDKGFNIPTMRPDVWLFDATLGWGQPWEPCCTSTVFFCLNPDSNHAGKKKKKSNSQLSY